jgi:hypothetical protein
MGKGHFVSEPGEKFDWKGFQAHMGYSDAEMQALRADPRKVEHVQQICSPAVQDRYLIAEVVEARGCTAGMEPGDRIFFKGMSVLDGEKSDAWCPYIYNTYWFTSGKRHMVKYGIEPDAMYVNYSGCMDVGPENGLGRVVYKMFTVPSSEVDKYVRAK